MSPLTTPARDLLSYEVVCLLHCCYPVASFPNLTAPQPIRLLKAFTLISYSTGMGDFSQCLIGSQSIYSPYTKYKGEMYRNEQRRNVQLNIDLTVRQGWKRIFYVQQKTISSVTNTCSIQKCITFLRLQLNVTVYCFFPLGFPSSLMYESTFSLTQCNVHITKSIVLFN